MPTDPFERNDRQDRIARGISKSMNLANCIWLSLLGLVLLVLGAKGVGGVLPIVIGSLSLLAAAYRFVRPFRV